jgi:hypothetical protein
MRALLLYGAIVLAGVTGAALTLAGVDSPATGPLTLVFVLVTPAVCVGLLLGGLDGPARVIVSGAASVTLAASIAEVMLVTSGWSPDGGVIATAVASALLALAALVLRRRSRPRKPAAVPPPGSEEPALES